MSHGARDRARPARDDRVSVILVPVSPSRCCPGCEVRAGLAVRVDPEDGADRGFGPAGPRRRRGAPRRRALALACVSAHSHAFQRELRGRASARRRAAEDDSGPGATRCTRPATAAHPESIREVARPVRPGTRGRYATVGEFHYVHHGPGRAVRERTAPRGRAEAARGRAPSRCCAWPTRAPGGPPRTAPGGPSPTGGSRRSRRVDALRASRGERPGEGSGSRRTRCAPSRAVAGGAGAAPGARAAAATSTSTSSRARSPRA